MNNFSVLRHKQAFARALGCTPFDEVELQRISILRHRLSFSLGLFLGSCNQFTKACNQAADVFEKFADAWKNSGLDEEDVE